MGDTSFIKRASFHNIYRKPLTTPASFMVDLQQPTSSNKRFIVIADTLNVRKSPSLQGEIIGSLSEGQLVDWIESSDNNDWYKVQRGNLTGWSFHKYLTLSALPDSLDEILQIAARSEIVNYDWADRGVAPLGYIKGMAVVYGRVYCKLKVGDAAAKEMAKENTGDTDVDALAHYAQEFHTAGMDNESAEVDTLRHLFVLLTGLGMRESSGRYCEGRDLSADNTTADTAEAGLFQMSYDARSASPFLPQLFQQYLASPSGFVDIFQEEVPCDSSDFENFGHGDGKEFQRLLKACPAFAVEFAALGLRNIRSHWGPVTRREVEIRSECDEMLKQVQHVVDASNLCSSLR